MDKIFPLIKFYRKYHFRIPNALDFNTSSLHQNSDFSFQGNLHHIHPEAIHVIASTLITVTRIMQSGSSSLLREK